MSERRAYVCFVAGGVACALPRSVVREVLDALPVTRVPGADVAVLGVGLARGEPVAMIDLGQRLGHGRRGVGATVLLVQAGDERVGLCVDAVTCDRAWAPDELARVGDGLTAATVDDGGETHRVLDVLGVLPPSMRG